MNLRDSKIYRSKLVFVTVAVSVLAGISAIVPWNAIGKTGGYIQRKAVSGDMDRDGDVDISDLAIFSRKWLGVDWNEVDWCEWVAQNEKEQKHLGNLYEFIVDYFGCDDVGPPYDPLAVRNSNDFPVRVACAPDNKFYVTDFKHGSVFIYDSIINDPNLNPIGELKGLENPLGVVVDEAGNIYVGSSKNDRVEVYDFEGTKIRDIGQGNIDQPNDMLLEDGKLYIVDSPNDTVWIYDPNGTLIGNIGGSGDGDSQLKFPVAIAIGYRLDETEQELITEIYVADKQHYTIKVYDLQGTYVRSLGGMVKKGGMMIKVLYWKGLFATIQELAFDGYGRIHTLDSQMAKAQILDPLDGSYIDHYGEYGTDPGQMKLPLGFAIDDYGNVVLANFDNRRVELIYTIP